MCSTLGPRRCEQGGLSLHHFPTPNLALSSDWHLVRLQVYELALRCTDPDPSSRITAYETLVALMGVLQEHFGVQYETAIPQMVCQIPSPGLLDPHENG